METSKAPGGSRDLCGLADEAIVCTWPLYEMRRARASTSYPTLLGVGTAPEGMRWANVFAHRRELIRPGVSKIVTPNNDTLYSVAWLDLGEGPLVIEVPEMHGRYHVLGLMDNLTNPFGHVGTRLHGSGPHSVLVSGPEWDGEVPDAYNLAGRHLRSTTRWVWVIGRILVFDPDDLPAVHALQDGLRIRRLEAGAETLVPFEPGCDPDESLGAGHFAEQVNAALRDCAGTTALDWTRIQEFGECGIGVGLTPTPAQLAVLEPAVERVRRRLLVPKATRTATHWQYFPILEKSFGDDDLLRAHVALQYIGMVESREAVYPMTWHDGDGVRLVGDCQYEIYFKAEQLPPVDAFWSLTLYESDTCRFVENAMDRYAIGDRTAGLVREPGDSLRISIGQKPPKTGDLRNWLPAPKKEFHLCLRAYLPRASILDGSYEIPAVHRL